MFEKPRLTAPGSKTVKVRYGPYKVPGVNVKNKLGEYGTMGLPSPNIEKYAYSRIPSNVSITLLIAFLGHALGLVLSWA